MEENQNNKKLKTASVLLKCLAVILVIVIAALFIKLNLLKQADNNEHQNMENERIDVIQKNKFKAPFEYDLEEGKLSNFDIAFLKAENKLENKIYSPLSIKYTLKMLEEGSNGTTKEQISNVLEDYEVTKYTSNQNMSLANAMFVRDSFKDSVKPSYIENLQNGYNADVIFDSFASADNVNSWVKDRTLDLLPNVLDEIDSSVDFILVNALGIDMEWNIKFFDSETRYSKGYTDGVEYLHENYSCYCRDDVISSLKFDNEKIEASGMELFASINNYDIVNVLGEENIRKTVGDAYRAWIKENGTDSWGSPLSGETAINNEVERYLDNYIKEIKSNYENYGEAQSIDFTLYNDDNVIAFAKDLKEYGGTTLQYISIMPKTEDLDKYVESIDSEKINNIINNLKDIKRENFKEGVVTQITGFIPKFKFDYTLNLMDDLAKIGVTDVFDKEKADISGLTTAEGEHIGDAIHKANIELTQDGIKASAATMMLGKGAGGPGFDYMYDIPVEEINLNFDKPYMFIIRDKDTGDVWFAGTVYEPLAYAEDNSTDKY